MYRAPKTLKQLLDVSNHISSLENKFQMDIKYIIKNEFWVIFRQIVILLAGISVSVAFARLSTKEVLGQYNFIISIISIVSILSIPGLNTSVSRSVSRGFDGCYKLSVKISFLWSLLAIPALAVTGIIYYCYYDAVIGICLIASGLFFPLIYAPNTWNSFLQGKKRFDVASHFSTLQTIINSFVLIIVLFYRQDNLVLIILAYLLSNSITTCTMYYLSWKYIENEKKDNECINYGYFITTTNITGTISTNIDRVLINILLGPSQLAIYSIAVSIPSYIKDLIKSIWSPFIPKFSQDNVSVKDLILKSKLLLIPSIILIVICSIVYLLFIDDIMLFFFGYQYADAIQYTQLLLLMVILSIPNNMVGQFCLSKKYRRSIMYGYNIFPYLRILILVVLIFYWGVTGAVYGLILSTVLQFVLVTIGMMYDLKTEH